MDKIFDQAKDKNVAVSVVYATADDGYLFVESSGDNRTKITTAELKDMFFKGMLVVLSGAYYAPVAYYETTSGDVTYGGVTVCSDAANYNFFAKEKPAG